MVFHYYVHLIIGKYSTLNETLMKLYGIKNCDTVKKAKKWLNSNNIEYTFVDFKTEYIDTSDLKTWLTQGQGAALVNTRGTTYRKLTDDEKANLTATSEKQNIDFALLSEQPTLIKRPVLVVNGHIEIGFSISRYEQLFN